MQSATKSPLEFSIELVHLILKSICKSKCAQLALKILKMINKMGLALPDIKYKFQYAALEQE